MKHWNIEVDAELVNLADSIDSVVSARKSYHMKCFCFTNSRKRDLVLLKMATIEFPLATSLLSIDKLTTSNDLIYQI